MAITISKKDYFIMGIKKGWYLDREWIKSLFSYYVNDGIPYIMNRDGETLSFEHEGEVYQLEGKYPKGVAPYRVGEMFTVVKDELSFPDTTVYTSYGCFLLNYILVYYPFNGKVPYFNKHFMPEDVINYILPKWERSKSEVRNDAKESEIYTEEYVKFSDACLYLTNFTLTFIPSVTAKVLKSNPLLDKRKKELYQEYADKLNDPVTQTMIDDELVKIDKAYLKDDVSKGFLTKGKMFNNIRKRLNNQFGMASTVDDSPGPYVPRPLRDGVDLTRYSDYINDSYSGSIGRGLETQIGGTGVKVAYRSAGNLKVTIHDCGSKSGKYVKFSDNPEKNKRYINYWYINTKGESVKITQENLNELTGALVLMRSPGHCHSVHSSYCEKCAGPNISMYRNSIASVNAIPGSRLMYVKMKKMHNTAKESVQWRISLFS